MADPKKMPTLSDDDLAAMIASEDEYLKIRARSSSKPPTKDIFFAGFHFGVAHARKAMAEGTPAPVREVVDDELDDDEVDDGD
jgi:hypothetical protein